MQAISVFFKRYSAWPVIWLGFFAIIVGLGVITPDSTTLTVFKLGGIMLCLFYTFWAFPKDHLLQMALVLTCIADFLLALNNQSAAGVFAFLIAQLTHFVRLNEASDYISAKALKNCLFGFSGFVATIISINAALHFIEPLHLISGFYALIIICNIYLSFRWWQAQKFTFKNFNPAACACLGFILFILCDSCVSLSYLSVTGVLTFSLYPIANFLAWLFYYPSQILISNSSPTKFINKSTKLSTKNN